MKAPVIPVGNAVPQTPGIEPTFPRVVLLSGGFTLYSLAGLWDQAAGWGLRGETFRVRDSLTALDCRPWFNVGDRDLAFHLLRADLLQSGLTLTEATRELARRLGIRRVEVIPASDQPSETYVALDDGGCCISRSGTSRRERGRRSGNRELRVDLPHPPR